MDLLEQIKPHLFPPTCVPFRTYYKGPTLKIYIIANILHNFEWLSAYRHKLTEQHVFLVMCEWFHSEWYSKTYDEIFERLALDKANFFFLCNDEAEKQNLELRGFRCKFVNHNCWLDENLIDATPTPKKYNAVFIARKARSKRHFLASQVKRLALICGGQTHGGQPIDYRMPPAIYRPKHRLPPEKVFAVMRQSSCGLALSAEEGACCSSGEYLLAGIPVVSTASRGGRDIWYDEYNSIICEDKPAKVAEAVDFFVTNRRDPFRIRQAHIELAQQHRLRFIELLQSIFDSYSIAVDAQEYLRSTFYHKMRHAQAPDFEKVFE